MKSKKDHVGNAGASAMLAEQSALPDLSKLASDAVSGPGQMGEIEEQRANEQADQYEREFQIWLNGRSPDASQPREKEDKDNFLQLAWTTFYAVRQSGLGAKPAREILRRIDGFMEQSGLLVTAGDLVEIRGFRWIERRRTDPLALFQEKPRGEAINTSRPAIPSTAPAEWKKDRQDSETAPDFIKRVYREWLGKGLYRSHLRTLDRRLYGALAEYLRENPLPPDLILPTRTERSAAEARAMLEAARQGAPLPMIPAAKEMARLATNLRRHDAAGRAAKAKLSQPLMPKAEPVESNAAKIIPGNQRLVPEENERDVVRWADTHAPNDWAEMTGTLEPSHQVRPPRRSSTKRH